MRHLEEYLNRRAREDRRERRRLYATHRVPHAGTLDQISYCAVCGMGFTGCRTKECPKTRILVTDG